MLIGKLSGNNKPLKTSLKQTNIIIGKNKQSKTVVPNKTLQQVTADEGYELEKVIVESIPDEYIIPDGTLDIANNGTYNVKDYVNVSVNVKANLISKEITANGTYNASDDGVDGYSNVKVNIGGESENKLAEFLSGQNITINASDFGNVTQIRQYCFYGSNIVGVEMPDTITSIGDNAFFSCGMMSQCKLSKNLTNIGSKAFSGCGLISVELPSGLKSIGRNAFQWCGSFKSVIIPSSLTSFGDYAFNGCSILESVIIQEGVTSIGSYTFQSCQKLVELVIPTTITEMGNAAFQSCTSLKNLTLPSGVKTLNSNVFGNCSSLEKVSFLENSQLTTISSGAFYLCSKVSLYDFRNCTKVPSLANVNALQHSVGCQIVVPDALYEEWTTASVWADLTDVVWVKASEYVEA